MPYFGAQQDAQKVHVRMIFPGQSRQKLVGAIEEYMQAIQLPALFSVRADGTVFAALAASQTTRVPDYGDALARRLGARTMVETFTSYEFDHPRDAMVLVPVKQREQFETSLPPVAQSWSTNLVGVRILERGVAGLPSTIIWGRVAEGEFIQDSLLGMSSHLRWHEDSSHTHVEGNGENLAEKLGAPYYWVFSNVKGVARFDKE